MESEDDSSENDGIGCKTEEFKKLLQSEFAGVDSPPGSDLKTKPQVRTPPHSSSKWSKVCLYLSVVFVILLVLSYAAFELVKHAIPPPTSDSKTESFASRFCRISSWSSESVSSNSSESADCSSFRPKSNWNVTFDETSSQSPIRFVDVNCDGILDVIVGITLEKNSMNSLPLSDCLSYESKEAIPRRGGCHGAILALDGTTGNVLWRRYSSHEVYAIQCEIDVNDDGDTDCLIAGYAATLAALDRHTGKAVWHIDSTLTLINENWGFYTPQITSDIDGDNIGDVIITHSGDPTHETERGVGLLLLLSGKTGQPISAMPMPDQRETYESPIVHVGRNEKSRILIGSGGETINGSLWAVDFDEFVKFGISGGGGGGVTAAAAAAAKSIRRLVQGIRDRGAMNPPLLVDLTQDGILDIVVALFDGRLEALDGNDFELLWRAEFRDCETYALPGIGRYTNDAVPDIMAIYNKGVYPTYFETTVAIVDGKTGEIVYERIAKTTREESFVSSSILAVKMIGSLDAFVYWNLANETGTKREQPIQFLLKHGKTEVVLFEDMAGKTEVLDNVVEKTDILMVGGSGIVHAKNDNEFDVVYKSTYRTHKLSTQDPDEDLGHIQLRIHSQSITTNCLLAPPNGQPWLNYMGTFGTSRYT